MATPQAAISSSAWCTMPPNRSKISDSRCDTDVAGVMGYMAQSSMPAAMAPSAMASLPFITTSCLAAGCVGISTRKSMLSSAQ